MFTVHQQKAVESVVAGLTKCDKEFLDKFNEIIEAFVPAREALQDINDDTAKAIDLALNQLGQASVLFGIGMLNLHTIATTWVEQ